MFILLKKFHAVLVSSFVDGVGHCQTGPSGGPNSSSRLLSFDQYEVSIKQRVTATNFFVFPFVLLLMVRAFGE